jgi:uncharacterized protein YqjF (DUF2071 family)
MAAVVAAAVRNRWGDTLTPSIRYVILEIKVPRFFVVIRRPVLDEIHRKSVDAFDPSKTGRDRFKYVSIVPLRISGTRLSSNLFAADQKRKSEF